MSSVSDQPISQGKAGAHVESVPALQNGDRLTRAEFERRYQSMTHLRKAELIEGVVYVGSPVGFEGHSSPHAHLLCWLGLYAANTPTVRVGDNGTVRLDNMNEPQPDAMLFLKPEHGGQARISDDDFVEGAPELAVEVESSSTRYDLHEKLNAYLRNGVKEYLIWQTREQLITWFVSRDGEFAKLEPDPAGVYKSETFPGLWLDSHALFASDLLKVIQTVESGVESAQHAAFIAN